MAQMQTDFTIADQTSGNIVGSGTITFDDSTLQVTSITGVINGASIDGLSNFGGSDNILTVRTIISMHGFSEYNYGVGMHGIAFSAGSTTYNLKETQYDDTPSHPVQSNDLLASDAGSSEAVTFSTPTHANLNPCFTAGTFIETVHGSIAVENLVVGDIVLTTSCQRTIIWIDSRTIIRPLSDECPVRISAGAFGDNLPSRDLLLSGGHPVLVGADEDGQGGYLIPIMCLINGTSIDRVPMERVTYWHIELDAHDILFAEGLPAESYIDLGSRVWFAGARGALCNPDLVLPAMPGRCRPVAIDGSVVEAERRRLDTIFATKLVTACDWPKESSTFE